mgnify:CR=1 FL=1
MIIEFGNFSSGQVYCCIIFERFEILKKEWDNLRVKAKRKDDNLLERKKNLSKKTIFRHHIKKLNFFYCYHLL